MASLNKVMLIGNLTREVEMRYTPGGMAVAQFALAMNRKYKDQAGAVREEATFVDVEAWGKTAELAQQYLAKGLAVFVEGRLKLEQWDDKQTGQKRSRMKVVIESMQFLPGQNKAGARAPAAGAASAAAPETAEPDLAPF